MPAGGDIRLLHQWLIPGLWLVWLAYWLAAAFFTKSTRREEPIGLRLLDAVPITAGALLLSWPDQGGWFDAHVIARSEFGFWLAAVCVAVGLGFAAAARVWLGANWSSSVVLKQDHELIRTGPYAVVRHPIYTGALLALLGSAIALSEWRGVLGFLLILAAFLRRARSEERFMREQFGAEYDRYCQQVPALLPFWR